MFKEREYCSDQKTSDVGKRILLAGWADRIRDLGGIIFVDLRDVSGIMQIVFDSSVSQELFIKAGEIKSEYCIYVWGVIRKRSEIAPDPNHPTGEIELEADELGILNRSLLPPIPLESGANIGDDLRLKYRYLDLRREDMKDAIIKRHIFMQGTRRYLTDNRFVEIETPILNKSTPEGARDYLVPSRINRGAFYALPQSPQLFKQILMVSGFDRYFQITKCFRDEDLRYDRQPEFTQIDIEMSFASPDKIIEIIEGMLKSVVKDVTGNEITIPFRRISYDDAIASYGCDAPDLRFELKLVECSDIFCNSQFKVFSSALSDKGIIKCFAVSDDGKISRKKIDEYSEYAKSFQAKGLPTTRFKNGSFEGGISKFISEVEKEKLVERLELNENMIIFFSSDRSNVVNDTLTNLRKKIANDMGLVDNNKLSFVWVTDFPLLEYDETDKRFYAKHHPFTSPLPDHIDLLDNMTTDDLGIIKAQAYDIVLNGVEIGGGSIRIDNPELQKKMFSVLGITEEEWRQKFSFLIDALSYGAPPHGGIALGLDRILMLLLKRNSIRDVIAFPKTTKGQCLMSEAPSPVSSKQLEELSIKVVEK
ncbi:MAG: aspartate--tRNA ligase [Spirochaetota bacterium]|nr:aspartate--tRNA ligase [Spirochaetota bacterium]